MDERGEKCSPRPEKALAAAPPPPEPPLAPSPADPLAALLANPGALQAILAAYSSAAGPGGGNPAKRPGSRALPCSTCTGRASCSRVKSEEKGKIIGEARAHFGKSPSRHHARHAPGGKGRGKGGGKGGEGRRADPSKPAAALPAAASTALEGILSQLSEGIPPPRPPPAGPSWAPPSPGAPSSPRASRSPACPAPPSSSCCAARTMEGNLGLPSFALRSRNYPRARRARLRAADRRR